MCDMEFVIPLNRNDLLETTYNKYFVKDLTTAKEIKEYLKVANAAFNDVGPEFILESFDIFFSVIYHADTLSPNVLSTSYNDLHKAMISLNNNLEYLLENKNDMDDETKKKYLNIIKMLLYLYVDITNYLLGKKESKNEKVQAKKGKKSDSDDNLMVKIDEKQTIHALNNIIQRDINFFWGGQYVDEFFKTMLGEVAYQTMQCYNFKMDHDLQNATFHFFGMLIKNYSLGDTFVIRIVHMIKSYDHIVPTIPAGIQLLVENYNCPNLLHAFIKEMCELLSDERTNENQGTKPFSNVLVDLAINLPTLMMPEIFHLNKYLAHESHILRNSILTIIVEIILSVLHKQNLSEEEKEDRDLFLSILQDHVIDINGLVRAKVFAHFARLQEENALPVATQINILETCVRHLRDKVVSVRKGAINCLKTFITYNIYGFNLNSQQYVTQCDKLKSDLNELNAAIESNSANKLEEWGGQWASKVDDIRKVIEEHIDEPCEDLDIECNEISKFAELIRLYVQNGNYVEALKICKYITMHVDECVQVRQTMDTESETDFLLTFMHYMYTDLTKILGNIGDLFSEEDLKKITDIKSSISRLENCIDYIRIINSSIPFINDLLDSQFITDFQVAIEFLVIANNFNIDNAPNALLNTLKYMEHIEQDRKDAVMNAFTEIYLKTDARNVQEHKEIVVQRLTRLVTQTSYEYYNSLTQLICAWSEKGTLDNNVIDMLWQAFTKNTDDTARSALELLKMCSIHRLSILSRNIKLISSIAFKERKHDFLLVKCACDTISIVGNQKQLITDENPPFRIKLNDELWDDLLAIITTNFLIPNKYFLDVITSVIHCIYSLCSTPDHLCNNIINAVSNDVQNELKSNDGKLTCFILTRFVHLFGEIAIRQFHYLDENIYKEMKRRNYVLENKKNNKRTMNSGKEKIGTASDHLDNSIGVDDMSFMEGAQAEDTDAGFIINVLENNVVNGTSILSHMTNVIVEICNNYNLFNDQLLQTVAIRTLGRYMIISSKFCKQFIHLFFAILEKTPHVSVKINIIVVYADLLERFPNAVESSITKLFDRLKDEDIVVRRSAFHVISHLVLKDVIRVQQNISELTIFLVSKEDELRIMSREFFNALAAKGHILYNVLPDIFSHLGDIQRVNQDEFTTIMKYFFGLLDKAKYLESLVDRFCIKFKLSDNVVVHRNAAFCLSLISFNEKFLRRLSDAFHVYKHALHDKEVYASFKTILGAASSDSKPEVKNVVAQIEEKMKNFFEVTEPSNSAVNVKRKDDKKRSKPRRRNSDGTSDEEDNVRERRRVIRPSVTPGSNNSDASFNRSRPLRNCTTSGKKRNH